MISLKSTRTVEDTLHDVQELIIHHRNTISDELLAEIEQCLLDQAITVRNVEAFKEYVSKISQNIIKGLKENG